MRAGVVFVASTAAQLVVGGLVGIALVWTGLATPGHALASWPTLAIVLPGYLAAIATVVLAWRVLDRRPQRDLGHAGPPSRAVFSFVHGVAAGALAIGTVVGLGWALGGWSFSREPGNGLAILVGVTPLLLLAAYWEELLVRGYLFQQLGRRSLAAGAVVSSLVFALAHLGNPGAWDGGPLLVVLASVNVLGAGLLLAVAFAWSRDLWFPTGAHVAWNWLQGAFFGLPVSGVPLPSLLRAEMRSESPIFGSAFGPESSLVTTLVVVLPGALGLAVLVRRGVRVPVVAAIEHERAASALRAGTPPDPHGTIPPSAGAPS